MLEQIRADACIAEAVIWAFVIVTAAVIGAVASIIATIANTGPQ